MLGCTAGTGPSLWLDQSDSGTVDISVGSEPLFIELTRWLIRALFPNQWRSCTFIMKFWSYFCPHKKESPISDIWVSLESSFTLKCLCDAARHMRAKVCRPGISGCVAWHTHTLECSRTSHLVSFLNNVIACMARSSWAESCGHFCVCAGAALQADISEGGPLLLVEERQADCGHSHRRAGHRAHHHPAGHRCDPCQCLLASCGQPYIQNAINTLACS